jgi:hypothetical protein
MDVREAKEQEGSEEDQKGSSEVKDSDEEDSDEEDEGFPLEYKFLTVRQIFKKIYHQYEHNLLQDFAPHFWWFQKATDVFPTIIVARKCEPSQQVQSGGRVCRHRVFFYYGGDVSYGMLTKSTIHQLLHQRAYLCPTHFIENRQQVSPLFSGYVP